MIVGAVACGSAKLSAPARADRLYTSTLFRSSARFVAHHSDEWVILSARHGVLTRDAIVEPYNVTLREMSNAERSRWRRTVRQQLDEQFGPDARYVTTAGRLYRDALPAERTACPWDEMPGMGIGRQMGWLKSQAVSPTWRPRWRAVVR